MNLLKLAVAAAITQPATSNPAPVLIAPQSLAIQASLIYGSGGATIDAYVQTSLDGGATWIDIAEFSFATASAVKVFNLSRLTPVTAVYTPTDGSLAANTAKDGILGDRFRVKYKSTGTYADTILSIDVVSNLV